MCKHFNMLTSVFLLSSLVAANGHMSVRIANGENQKVFTPFYVQVIHNSYVDYDGTLHETRNVCGGTVFRPSFVVTHAACATKGEAVEVRGAYFQKRSDEREERDIKIPKEYVFVSGSNEDGIAVIRIPQNVPAEQILPPCEQFQLPSGSPLAVVGMGTLSARLTLFAPQLQFMHATEYLKKCDNDTICTIGSPRGSTCTYDRGAPLMLLNSTGQATCLYGVVSKNYLGKCEWDDISVRLASHIDFIRKVPGMDLK